MDELAVRRAANVGLVYRYATRRADRMEFGWNVFWMCGLTSHPSILRVAGVVLMSAVLAACLGLRLLLEGLKKIVSKTLEHVAGVPLGNVAFVGEHPLMTFADEGAGVGMVRVSFEPVEQAGLLTGEEGLCDGVAVF